MNITKLMKEAVKESRRSSTTHWRIGAIVVRGNRIIARGYNRSSAKIDKVSKKLGIPVWTLHAEMDALLKADAAGATLFVAGRKSNGRRVHAKPCQKCEQLAREFGVIGVYWEDRDGCVNYYDLT